MEESLISSTSQSLRLLLLPSFHLLSHFVVLPFCVVVEELVSLEAVTLAEMELFFIMLSVACTMLADLGCALDQLNCYETISLSWVWNAL